MCSIPYTGEVQALDTKSFYVSATFLCTAKYLLSSVMVGSLQEEIAGRTDHLELNAIENFFMERNSPSVCIIGKINSFDPSLSFNLPCREAASGPI